MRLTVEQAVADLDKTIEAATNGPVHIERGGKDVAVLLSPAQYEALIGHVAHISRPEFERLMAASIERHGSVYRALTKWEAENEPPAD